MKTDTSLAPLAAAPAALLPHLSSSTAGADQIRCRAYQIYRSRAQNGGAGDAVSDWLEAEREINGSAKPPTPVSVIETKSTAKQEPARVAAR